MSGKKIRQVSGMDILLLDLDDQYATRIDLVQEMMSGSRTRAPLWRKNHGKLIPDGLLFPARTGKTIYAFETCGRRRWRFATWQFERVVEKPGIIAEALFCPPRPEVTS